MSITHLIDTKKIDYLLWKHDLEVKDVAEKSGMLNLKTTFSHVKNNTGNVGSGQREKILNAYAAVFGIKNISYFYAKKKKSEVA